MEGHQGVVCEQVVSRPLLQVGAQRRGAPILQGEVVELEEAVLCEPDAKRLDDITSDLIEPCVAPCAACLVGQLRHTL